ncbi:hypothetical protein SAMN05660413_03372 [Salegentibacter flavus]|uniref:Uncharacterized protein n=2 Tax=Salegentibacter flavus TaxID=287099 RepID=A0A1I5DKA8_9FLAO|nr:hypothetical protein SAMN05660413_03372 [Salegentibacter flavus]
MVDREMSDQGMAKFYIETDLKESRYEKRLLATVDNSLYYSFYPDKIVKQTSEHKELIYTLYFDRLPDNYNRKSFKKISATDSIILSKGSTILDSLGWTDYQKPNEARAFLIEVNYYHGYPKNKRFKP